MSTGETKHNSIDSMDMNPSSILPYSMDAEAPSKISEIIDISIDVNIISASMGGSAKKIEYSAPAMAAGTTHRVSTKHGSSTCSTN